MAKIVLTKPTSGYNLAAINNNFTLIEQEFQDKVLYRDNPIGEANSLETDVDANSKRIYNLPTPALPSEAARLQDVQNAIGQISTANLTAFTPAGDIAATNVQAAIQELDSEKAATSSLAASSGSSLVGGGAQVVSSLTALRALLKTSPSTKAFITGGSADGDGGGSLYYYDSSDTTSTDNGLTIIVATDGGRWKTAGGNVEPVLTATEGVTFANGYRSASVANLDVPTDNSANKRYWTASYTVNVPAGATIPAGDVRHDHAAMVGHARAQSDNSRIWGAVGLAQADQSASSDAEMGACIGGEFDLNNNTGRDSLTSDIDFTAVQMATGGNSMSTAGFAVSALGTSLAATVLAANRVYRIAVVGTTDFTLIGAGNNNVGTTFIASGAGTGTGTAQPGGFYAGGVFKEYACRFYGLYFANVAPLSGALFLSDQYSGGPAVNVRNGYDALYLRNATSTGHSGRVASSGDQMKILGGASGGYVASHNDTETLMSWTNSGTFIFKRDGVSMVTVATAGTIASLAPSDGAIKLSAATQITTVSAADAVGQRITLFNTVVGTCTYVNGSGMLLAGSANFVANQYSTLTLLWEGGSWIEVARSAR